MAPPLRARTRIEKRILLIFGVCFVPNACNVSQFCARKCHLDMKATACAAKSVTKLEVIRFG